jgi:predicted HNH restriction endonuclease
MTKINKQNRTKLILERGDVCERCQLRKVKQIHHKNVNKKDNTVSNLLLLCDDCHRAIHKEIRGTVNADPHYR